MGRTCVGALVVALLLATAAPVLAGGFATFRLEAPP